MGAAQPLGGSTTLGALALAGRAVAAGGLAIVLLASPAPAAAMPYRCAAELYVSPVGSDAHDGSAASPFRSISHALNDATVKAGVCIDIAPGDYQEIVNVTKGGDAPAPTGFVVLRAPGRRARIIGPAAKTYSTLTVAASFVIIDGLDVSGGGGGHCIDGGVIDQRTGLGMHHIVIENSTLHDCGGGGVELAYGDWYWIENNVVHDTSSSNGWQTSGISVYQPRAAAGESAAGAAAALANDPRYHIVIASNVSHDNVARFPCPPTQDGCHTDGNGVILDDFNNTQRSPPGPAYPFRALVFNNIVYRNGGRGVQLGHADRVTVINNTAFDDNLDAIDDATWRGEIQNAFGSFDVFANNIAVAVPRAGRLLHNTALNDAACCGYRAVDNLWAANLTFDGAPGEPSASASPDSAPIDGSTGNLLGVDPGFLSSRPPYDVRLRPDSPARGRADAARFRAAAIEPSIGRFTGDLGATIPGAEGAAR